MFVYNTFGIEINKMETDRIEMDRMKMNCTVFKLFFVNI